MSTIQDQVLSQLKKALEASGQTPPAVIDSVLAELTSTGGPNAEKLADLFRTATVEAVA